MNKHRPSLRTLSKDILLIFFLYFNLLMPFSALSQCPGTGCTVTISGVDGTSYTINSGEKICFNSGAIFTGTINLYGGTLTNCATATQTFTINTSSTFPNGIIDNYGTIQHSSSQNFGNGLTINNYGTLVYTNLSLNNTATINNYGTVNLSSYLTLGGTIINESDIVAGGDLNGGNTSVLDNSGNFTANSIDLSGLWTNSGIMNSNSYSEFKSASVGTINGGCINTNSFTNRGIINGTSCGNIYVNTSSANTTGAILSGDIAIIDFTPPGSAPFIDTPNGTIGTGIVWSSCTACGTEICGNFTDDNGDGRVDEPFPGGVQADMQLWLKAESGTNTTTNGGDVTSWADQSVNAYSANADVNTTDNPIYSDNELNFNPGITFDGTYTDDFSDGLHLGSDYIFSSNDGLHIFAVVNISSGGLAYDKVFDFGGTVTTGYGFTWSSGATRVNSPTSFGGASGYYGHATGIEPSLLEFEIKFDDNQTLYKDGNALVNYPGLTLSALTSTEIAESDHYGTAANGDAGSGPVSIGRKSASEFLDQDRVFNGSISEILVYNDTLSQNEKEKINSYLAIKYGITMPHDYVSSAGTSLKSISDSYSNNVFGIGRDDCSGLYQKQSKSVEPEGIITISVGAIAANNQSNASVITSDESFLMIGDDGLGVNAWNIIGGFAASTYRINRTWKVNRTLLNQNVTFTIDMDDVDLDVAAIPVSATTDYQIMFDIDGDFTNGGNITTGLTNTTGSLYEVTINSSAYQYFTIVHTGPAEEICGNFSDDNNDGRIDESFPGGVQADLQLWLKAETGTNTVVDGIDVTSWNDQSVNDYTATPSSSSTDDPIYSTNAINYNPGVEFDGTYTDNFSDGLMLGTDFIFSTNDGVHVFIVCDPNIGGERRNYPFDFGHNPNGGYGVMYSDTYFGSYTTGDSLVAAHSYGDEAALLELDIDAFRNRYRNGSLIGSDAITISELVATNISDREDYGTIINSIRGPISIGRKSASSSISASGEGIFNGPISEILVYNDSLTIVDKEKINSYLAIKYGITLNHDYVSSSETLIKDISDGYANEITIIGRDDCSGLNQKQSKSVSEESIISIALSTHASTNATNANGFFLDESFFVIGHNGAALNSTWTSANNNYATLDRVWKVDETSLFQNVDFSISVDNPDFDLPPMPAGATGSYYILFGADADFTTGGISAIALSNFDGNMTYSESFLTPSLSYFTIGILTAPEEICGNTIDDNLDGRIDEVYPGGVQADMQLWLKGEVGTNTNVDGNDVTSWTDQSVNNYSANADVNSTDNPAFTENAINFNPGVDFDGTYTDSYSDGLHLGSDYIFGEKDGVHVFIVCDPDVVAGTDKYVFDFGLQANGGYGMIYSDNDYGMYTNNSNGGTNTELFHTHGEAPALVEMKVDFDDAQEFYRNGTLLSSIAVTIPDLDAMKVNEASVYGPLTGVGSTTGPVSIGRKSASVFLDQNSGRLFDGRISEVLIYTDTLSSLEKQKVNSYLAIKYGLTINQDYVSSSGTVKKDITDGYANDIAGIGRDDCSGLHQKQSKSIESDGIITIGKTAIAATNEQNANSISADGSYLFWGNDGALANLWVNSTVSISGTDLSRIDRVWKLTESFDITNVLVQIEVDNPNLDLPAMPGTADGNYYLLRDDDGDFTNGGTTYEVMTFNSGDEWQVSLADPNDEFISIGVGQVCSAQAPILTK